MLDTVKPECFFFTDLPSIAVQSNPSALSFGPQDANIFKLTSKFSLTAESNAYSVCKGVVLIQPQTGTNKVNLLLRPYKQPFPGLNIKYFVYRGLKKSDFFGPPSGSNPPPVITSGSDFINKINEDFNAFYSEDLYDNQDPPVLIPDPVFTSNFIGYDSAVTDLTIPISSFFFKESEFVAAGTTFDESDGFELPMIDGGKSLGHFEAGECGIDVVLNYGDYKHEFDNGEFLFNLEYARAVDAKITLSGTDIEKKLQREQITQFIDIAAFYGLFAANGNVKVISNAGAMTPKTGTAIYNEVLTPFATKSNWYIYLQGDRTRSYNFYRNYKISDTNLNSLKLGITPTTLSDATYDTLGWPLLINTLPQATTDGKNRLFLQLVTDNNVNVMLYGQMGIIENAQQNNFCNAEDLRLPPDTSGVYGKLTKMIELSTPSITVGSQQQSIASISLLLYQGVTYSYVAGQAIDPVTLLPVDVFATPNFFDDVFDLIKSKPLLKAGDDTGFSKMTSEKLNLINHYYDRKQQGISAVQTLTVNDLIDTGIEATPTLARVTYVSETIDLVSDTVSVKGASKTDTKTSPSASGTIAKSKMYNLPEPYFYTLKVFTDSTTTVNGLELKTIDGSSPTKIILGITNEENETLKSLVSTTTKNPRLFLVDLFEDGSELLSPENIKYQKYKVGIVGENSGGILKLSYPTNDVMVYSLDRKYHFSKSYSEYVKDETIIDDFYIVRNLIAEID